MKNKIHIYLDDGLLNLIDSYAGTRSGNVAHAIRVIKNGRLVVFSIYNELKNRVYVGVCDVSELSREDFIARSAKLNAPLLADLQVYGHGEFSVGVLGLFGKRSEASLYCDIKSSEYAMNGVSLYNSDSLVEGLVFIRLPVADMAKITAFCAKKGKTLNQVVSWLLKRIIKK